ncbi:MAG TPA: thiamine pyrophosphate-dependent enzyme, partial [Ignavibacteriaceae bacterium]
KPLEPFSYTDDINKSILKIKPQRYLKSRATKNGSPNYLVKTTERIAEELIKNERGIIIVGPMGYDREQITKIKKLSTILKYPVFADGISQLRFGVSKKDKNIISNFNAILQSENFVYKHDPDIILQFGRTPTSSEIETFLSDSKADRYVINQYGDLFDPTRNAKATRAVEPKSFCESLISKCNSEKISRHKSNWIKDFIKAEEISSKIKSNVIESSKFPNEPAIIAEIFKSIPSGSSIFIGNSLPVRDLDNFLGTESNRFTLHFNRGASGIDGVTSTALGIAIRKKPTILITGDLSFLHDLNALLIASKYSILITVIVINNNGGGIFETLPIAQKVNRFGEFFIASHNLDLSGIVKSFGIKHQLVNSRSQLNSYLLKSLKG